MKAVGGMKVSRKLEAFLIIAPFVLATAILLLVTVGDRIEILQGPAASAFRLSF